MSALSVLRVFLSAEHILTKIAAAHRNVPTQMKICCFLARSLSYYCYIFHSMPFGPNVCYYSKNRNSEIRLHYMHVKAIIRVLFFKKTKP